MLNSLATKASQFGNSYTNQLLFSKKLSIIEKFSLFKAIKLKTHSVPNAAGNIIFWRGCPNRGSIQTESVLTLALRLRQQTVTFILADEALPACLQRSILENQPTSQWATLAKQDFRIGTAYLDQLGNRFIGVGKLVSLDKQASIRQVVQKIPSKHLKTYLYDGVPVGLIAHYSTLRYLLGYPLKERELEWREYLYSAIIVTEAAKAVIKSFNPSKMIMQRHLEYSGWAPAYYVFTHHQIPVTLWSSSATLDGRISLINQEKFSLNHIYAISEKSWQKRKNNALTQIEKQHLIKILNYPWLKMPNQATAKTKSKNLVINLLKLNSQHPIWCLFTHVSYDAGINPENMLFSDVNQWVLQSIEAMRKNKHIQWLVKIHPSENHESAYSMEKIIRSHLPNLPRNIQLIPANSTISTNDLTRIISGGITIQGTIGIQLSVKGLPVICAGKTHYTQKGFSLDPKTETEYYQLIHQAHRIKLLSRNQIELAQKYAYSWFFQRSFKLNMVKKGSLFSGLDPKNIHLILPGKDKILDFICQRIINGGEFILDS